jgi:hypothetical protein
MNPKGIGSKPPTTANTPSRVKKQKSKNQLFLGGTLGLTV